MIMIIFPENGIIFGSGFVKSSQSLQDKTVFGDWEQEKAEKEHDYFGNSSQVAEDV